MVKLNKIYTRTGDDGSTGLVGGARVSKASLRVVAYGDVDEANSALGLAVCAVKHADLKVVLQKIQNQMFDLGADLSNPGPDDPGKPAPLRVTTVQTEWLETQIDHYNKNLDALKSFVLPGGEEASARLHLARAVCRRAERGAVALAKTDAVNANALIYLNRLSDFLFVAARWCNAHGCGDVLWVPGEIV